MMTFEQARKRAAHQHARIVEIVYFNGQIRLNVLLPGGRPRTWRCSR